MTTPSPGTRLGPYEITAQIGEGGMGLVFKARDSQLGREVALKVLPEGFTADSERVARFEREAKLLASLNHPNIAQIYGLETAPDGTRALVMELVEGPTLAERLAQGSLPMDEALSLARQIAEAFEEAHEKGIIHRDLKPQNVKASIEGKVKVLDFGLAKAMDPAGSASTGSPSAAELARSPTLMNSPTLSALGGTRLGVILGTAAYMAPEQARGGAVDKRADIWAFGVVLYEMLAGSSLFAGETVSDTLAAVLKGEIALSALPAETPPAIRRLLRRCLERNPKNRLHDIADARIVIDEVLAGHEKPAVAAAQIGATTRRGRLPWAIVGASLLVAAASFWSAGRAHRSATDAPPALRLELLPPQGEHFPSTAAVRRSTFAISPDGTRLVYLVEKGATTEIRLRALDSEVATPVPGTEGATGLFFSPDGKWVGFFAGPKLEKVALAGGAPIALADAPDARGAVWGEDGNIYFVPNAYVPVTRVPAAGGAAQPVTRIRTDEGELQHRWPALLPGGKVLLYAVGFGGDWDAASIVAERLDSGERKVLVRGGSSPRFLPSGELVYARAASLYAVGLDPRTLTVTGPPVEVAHNVYISTLGNAAMDFSRSGLLVTAPANATGGGSVLSWIDRAGRSERLPAPAADYNYVTLSPTEDRAALGVGNSLAVLDLSRLSLAPLSLARRSEQPLWSRDGRRLLFGYEASARGYELYAKAADDSGEPVLVAPSGATEDPYAISRDGTRLLSIRSPTDGRTELVMRDLREPKGEPKVLLRSAYLLWSSIDLSPDDQWVVYPSVESGRPEIYVRPASGEERKWQVSVDGGTSPNWSRDGDEIFFLRGESLLAAPVHATRDGLAVGTPSVLFDGHRIIAFDAAADGRRFLAAEDPNPGARMPLDVVVNWFTEVQRKVAEARSP